MHLHLILIALVAPLTLSLPQPIPQGETGALVPRRAPSNHTHGVGGETHKAEHHGPPEGHLPKRTPTDRQSSGNSTREVAPHDGEKKGESHHGGPQHPERDLVTSKNSTGTHGGVTSGKVVVKPGNSTSTRGGEHHGEHHGEYHGKDAHHLEDHFPPKFDKRIEERNGTAGGYPGREKKFRPDGQHAGAPLHERSSLEPRLDNSTSSSSSSGKERVGKHVWKEGGHGGHQGPE